MKNMIAGPSLIEVGNLKVHKQSCSSSIPKEGGIKIGHKNSLVGPCYNSDTEDNKQSSEQDYAVKDEVNREAKHWNKQFHR